MGKVPAPRMSRDFKCEFNRFGSPVFIQPARNPGTHKLDLYSSFCKWVFSLFGVKCLPFLVNEQIRYVKSADVEAISIKDRDVRVSASPTPLVASLQGKTDPKEITPIVREILRKAWNMEDQGL